MTQTGCGCRNARCKTDDETVTLPMTSEAALNARYMPHLFPIRRNRLEASLGDEPPLPRTPAGPYVNNRYGLLKSVFCCSTITISYNLAGFSFKACLMDREHFPWVSPPDNTSCHGIRYAVYIIFDFFSQETWMLRHRRIFHDRLNAFGHQSREPREKRKVAGVFISGTPVRWEGSGFRFPHQLVDRYFWRREKTDRRAPGASAAVEVQERTLAQRVISRV